MSDGAVRIGVARHEYDSSRYASVDALVRAAQGGCQDAFEALYGRFHRAVHAIVLARVSLSDSDDVVQDVFSEAWTKIEAVRNPAAFPGWLRTLARNRAIDHARRRGSTVELHDVATVDAPLPEALAALRALRELPDAYAETLAMRLIEGMSGPEIAAKTGMTPDSVRVNLHRGFRLLRAKLGGGR